MDNRFQKSFEKTAFTNPFKVKVQHTISPVKAALVGLGLGISLPVGLYYGNKFKDKFTEKRDKETLQSKELKRLEVLKGIQELREMET